MAQNSVLTIILNYRTPDMTLRCAEIALREMQDIPGEILIVDNASGDGSYETITEAAQARGWLDGDTLRVHASEVNGGFGAGMNIGFELGLRDGTKPDFYFLLNSDAFLHGGSLQELRRFLIQTPKAGIAGSRLVGEDGEPHCSLFRFPTIASEFETAAATGVITRILKRSVVPLAVPDTVEQADWIAGASMMIRREVVDRIGGFDEAFFLYFEETELCHRAAQAGFHSFYVPTSEVTHVGSVSTGMKTWKRVPEFWFDSRLHYFTMTKGRSYAVAATLARLLGASVYGLRRLFGKQRREADHFYPDLLRHHLNQFRRPERTQRIYFDTAKESGK